MHTLNPIVLAGSVIEKLFKHDYFTVLYILSSFFNITTFAMCLLLKI